jgi:aryl-alcohol dehydrogenase-like predicted oxidoreductase
MRTRKLGGSGLATAPLVFGGNVFGWTADEPTSFALLDAFVAGGGTTIDTADVYMRSITGQGGESETVIGRWLKRRGRRDDVIIVTKVGHMPGAGGEGLAPGRIAAAIDESLARLQTDYVDVYLGHRDDPRVPVGEQIAAFDRLVKAGKVRAIGVSNYEPARILEGLRFSDAAGLARFTVMEPQYSLVERAGFEGQRRALALAEDIGVIPYFSLASGFLTGKYRSPADVRGDARSNAAARYLDPRGLAVLAALDEVAAEAKATPAQAALAWAMAQPGITAPIASATRLAQLEELMGAMRLELTPAQIARLDAASAPAPAEARA